MSRSNLVLIALSIIAIASLACSIGTVTTPVPPARTPAPVQPTSTQVVPVVAVASATPTKARPTPTNTRPTATAVPTVALPAGTLFNDEFASQQDSEGLGWSFEGGDGVEYSVARNQQTISIQKKQFLGLNWPDGTYGDFGAEIEAQSTGSAYAEYGLAFRVSGEQNKRTYYIFGVTTDGRYYVQKKVNGQWADKDPVAATSSQYVKQGKALNTLGVLAQGNNMSFYINGFLVKTVTDDSSSKGNVGIFAGTGDNDSAQVAFRRLTILTTDKAKADWGTTPAASSQPAATPATVGKLPADPPRRAGTTVTVRNTFAQSCRLVMWGAGDVTIDAGANSSSTAQVKPGTYGWRVFIGGRETEQTSDWAIPQGGACVLTCSGSDQRIYRSCN